MNSGSDWTTFADLRAEAKRIGDPGVERISECRGLMYFDVEADA